MSNNPTWEKNYKSLKRYNKYPFDFIVSYTKKYIIGHLTLQNNIRA